jgi:hypothetical protein
METTNDIIGHIDRLYCRFGNWTTFERYWFADCFVAFDARKVPYVGDVKCLNPLKCASVSDPSTWRDPSNVFGALISDKSGTLVGIGYVLHGDGTVCIDLDDVVDEQGNITPEAQRILDRFPNTYAEYSFSKRGIHIWLRTSRPLPADGRVDKKRKVEIYQNKRFIAITMDILPNRPQEMADYTDELHDFYRELFGDNNNLPDPPNGGDVYQPNDDNLRAQGNASNMDDDQLIARIRRKRDCDILWNGGQLAHHPTPSHADCSLAYRLMWYTGGDRQQAYRLFCQSRRAHREKILKRPDLIYRAINAAYNYYLQYRSRLTQQAQPVKSVKKDVLQSTPRQSKVSTRSYGSNKRLTQSDPFVKWFTNCVEIAPDEMTPNSLAYQHYCNYVRRFGQKPLSAKKWAQLMAQKQIPLVQKMRNGQRTRYRVGIRLNQQQTTTFSKANKVATESDLFVKWFTNCVQLDPDGVVSNELAYQSYCDYVRRFGQKPLSVKKWAQLMDQNQVFVVRRMSEGIRTRCRVGIRLVQPSG